MEASGLSYVPARLLLRDFSRVTLPSLPGNINERFRTVANYDTTQIVIIIVNQALVMDSHRLQVF